MAAQDGIKLFSDSLRGNLGDANAAWVVSGNVRLEHGTRAMQASEMTVQRQDAKVVRVLAQGEPVRFEQCEPVAISATSTKVTYNTATQTLVLAGAVELLHGGNQVRGERIEYDLLRGELVAGSDNPQNSKQIEFVLEDVD